MANLSDFPLMRRISHWVNLINFLMLGITGYLIHAPFTGMDMNLVRNLHFFFMYFLIINGLVRLYYAFFGQKKDYKDFAYTKEDIKNFIPQIKYYLFLGKHPKTGKFNPLQKLAYLSLPILTVVQAITGLILYMPVKFAGWAEAFGGLASVRGIHYALMWVFFAIILVHVYLVFTEGRKEFWMMFFAKDKDLTKVPQSPDKTVPDQTL